MDRGSSGHWPVSSTFLPYSWRCSASDLRNFSTDATLSGCASTFGHNFTNFFLHSSLLPILDILAADTARAVLAVRALAPRRASDIVRTTTHKPMSPSSMVAYSIRHFVFGAPFPSNVERARWCFRAGRHVRLVELPPAQTTTCSDSKRRILPR